MIKRKQILSLLVVIVLMMQSFAFAEPSSWAVDLVESSVSEGLVPTKLKSDYQSNVKRFEYVLLALKILDANGVNVEIINAKPFTDINGHPYETEIIKAFNAGIVGGYEDQTFRADNDISREEVTALVYNLVKKINPETVLPQMYATYSDSEVISKWAKPYVEFNHQNKIMSGTGTVKGLDTIDPKGKASREQAIILLYKVFKNQSLLHQPYRAVDISGMGTTKSSEDVFGTAQSVGFDVMDEAITLSEETEAGFIFMNKGDFTLGYTDTTEIEVMDSKYDKVFLIKLKELSNTVAISDYKKMLTKAFPSQKFNTTFDEIISGFRLDNGYVLNKVLSDTGIVTAYSEKDEDVLYFFIKYKRNK